MITLLIENGMLLKPYTLPWKPDGWNPPPGWTPKRGKWVRDYADKLQRVTPTLPREFALETAETEHGKFLQSKKLPWPGWIFITVERDPDISRAYRELFVKMNPQIATLPLDQLRLKAKYPPDGFYKFHKRKMEPVR
jgi:hypothetical protein